MLLTPVPQSLYADFWVLKFFWILLNHLTAFLKMENLEFSTYNAPKFANINHLPSSFSMWMPSVSFARITVLNKSSDSGCLFFCFLFCGVFDRVYCFESSLTIFASLVEVSADHWMSTVMCSWIQFVSILLRICIQCRYRSTVFIFCYLFGIRVMVASNKVSRVLFISVSWII